MPEEEMTRFNMAMTVAERQVVNHMARWAYLSVAAFIRKLIRDEAAKQGLWPPEPNEPVASAPAQEAAK